MPGVISASAFSRPPSIKTFPGVKFPPACTYANDLGGVTQLLSFGEIKFKFSRETCARVRKEPSQRAERERGIHTYKEGIIPNTLSRTKQARSFHKHEKI